MEEITISKKSLLVSLAVIAVLVFGVMGVVGSKSNINDFTGNTIINPTNEVQNVQLSFKNYEYVLSPSTLKVDVPVRMEVDMDTVFGCMRDVTIPAFNVRQTVSEGNNIIEFTPTKTGTFNIACSMNMGRGQFSVVESDGSSSNYVEAQDQGSGSCGDAGGCGCGK